MDFEIKSDNEYSLLFSDQSHDKNEWLTDYAVSLNSSDMSGIVRVDNPPYGQSPLVLFDSVKNEWRGWEGEKRWGSMEGEFDLSAISDNTGHITLTATIFSGHSAPASRMVIELVVESSQLDQIAKTAKEFFGSTVK